MQGKMENGSGMEKVNDLCYKSAWLAHGHSVE